MVKPSYSALTEGEVYVSGLPAEYVAERYGIALEAKGVTFHFSARPMF